MEEARRALFERVIKKYTLEEVVRHRRLGVGQKNLIELVARYPGQGLGFKVFKKTWQQDHFFHVKRVDMFVSILGVFLTVILVVYRMDATGACGATSTRMVS